MYSYNKLVDELFSSNKPVDMKTFLNGNLRSNLECNCAILIYTLRYVLFNTGVGYWSEIALITCNKFVAGFVDC